MTWFYQIIIILNCSNLEIVHCCSSTHELLLLPFSTFTAQHRQTDSLIRMNNIYLLHATKKFVGVTMQPTQIIIFYQIFHYLIYLLEKSVFLVCFLISTHISTIYTSISLLPFTTLQFKLRLSQSQNHILIKY